MGRVTVELLVSASQVISIVAYVVNCNVPFLLGFDIKKKLAAVLEFQKWQMRSKIDGRVVPKINKSSMLTLNSQWTYVTRKQSLGECIATSTTQSHTGFLLW